MQRHGAGVARTGTSAHVERTPGQHEEGRQRQIPDVGHIIHCQHRSEKHHKTLNIGQPFSEIPPRFAWQTKALQSCGHDTCDRKPQALGLRTCCTERSPVPRREVDGDVMLEAVGVPEAARAQRLRETGALAVLHKHVSIVQRDIEKHILQKR